MMSHAAEDCSKLERLLQERNGRRSWRVLYLARPAPYSRSRTQPLSWLDVSHTVKFISKVWPSNSMLTTVRDTFRNRQPMQILEKWSHVVILPRLVINRAAHSTPTAFCPTEEQEAQLVLQYPDVHTSDTISDCKTKRLADRLMLRSVAEPRKS